MASAKRTANFRWRPVRVRRAAHVCWLGVALTTDRVRADFCGGVTEYGANGVGRVAVGEMVTLKFNYGTGESLTAPLAARGEQNARQRSPRVVVQVSTATTSRRVTASASHSSTWRASRSPTLTPRWPISKAVTCSTRTLWRPEAAVRTPTTRPSRFRTRARSA